MLKRTSAEEIRRGLAERIISGDLAPGTALDESLIAAEFAVSRTPVREALRLLAASGLVDQRPHAKALVAKPDEAELAGMFEVMAYLEALCAGLAALAMTRDERKALDRRPLSTLRKARHATLISTHGRTLRLPCCCIRAHCIGRLGSSRQYDSRRGHESQRRDSRDLRSSRAEDCDARRLCASPSRPR